MNDIFVKTKQMAPPLLLGWILTVWLPVPHFVSRTCSMAVTAAINGVQAFVSTVHGGAPEKRATKEV